MLAGPRVLDGTAAAFEAHRGAAARATPDRRDGGRRGRRRRQARQAGGGAHRLHDGELSGARSARRRPRRADRRACGACTKRASSDSSRSSRACPAATIRPASPTAPSSRPKSSASRRRAHAAAALRREAVAAAEAVARACAILPRDPPPRATARRIATHREESSCELHFGSFDHRFALAAAALVAATAHAQTLRIGLAEDPDVLDPTLARTFVGRIVFAALCDKLFDIDEKLTIVPQLATSYEWSADSKALTLKIRPGVTFHDGEKLDAAAVKYNLERHKTMTGSNRRGELAPVASVDVVDPIDGAPQPVRAVRAAARAARRPRRDDGLAEGRAGGRRQVRRQAGVLGTVPLRRARRAGPHRRRALPELLEQGRDPLRPDRLPADRRQRRCASPT